MAVGDGFGRLLSPNQLTPLPSAAQTAPNPLPEAIARAAGELERRVKPAAIERARRIGEADGAAGVVQDRAILSDMDAAYAEAAQSAYLAREQMQRDVELDDLALQFEADPDGFLNAADQKMRGVLAGAAPQFAPMIEQSWRSGIQRRARPIARRRQTLQAQKDKDDIDARLGQARSTLQALARNGELGGPEAEEALIAFDDLLALKQRNPLWKYGEAEAARDRAVLTGEIAGLSLGRQLLVDFDTMTAPVSEGGQGLTALHARAKALEALNTAFETNEVLKGMGEAERARIRRMADDAFTQQFEARTALRKAEEDAEREAERQQRERYEQAFNTLLPIADAGGMTEAQVRAARERGEITPRQEDALLSQVRAARSRDLAQERMARAAERSAAAAERSAEADARREAREGSQAITYDLRDLAETDPDEAMRRAQRLLASGVLTRADFNSIRGTARAEWGSDDRLRVGDMSRWMRSVRLPPERVQEFTADYRRWLDANPNATSQQRDAWMDGYKKHVAQRTAPRPGGVTSGGAPAPMRTLAQVRADIAAVQRSALPQAQKASRIDELNREERRIRAAQ